MKSPQKFLTLGLGITLAFVALLFACNRTIQQSEKPTVSQLRTHKEAIDTLQATENVASKPLEVTQLKEKSEEDLLNKTDFSSLWLANAEMGDSPVLNGFYGPDRYRIEMYFKEVTKDVQNVNLYHVKGKSRFKKNITPFEGTITIDSLVHFIDPNLDTTGLGVEESYHVFGTFELKEEEKVAGSGIFRGKMLMDFGKNSEGLSLWYFSQSSPAKGSGFLFDGEWQSYKTAKTKPVIWAKDIFMFADQILKNFSIGERDVEINPKYRKLGWDNFWENDEWWHDAVQ